MTDLTAFAKMTLDELTAEIERMTRGAKQRADDRAQKYAGNTFTPATTPALPPAANPPGRAVAGTHSPEAA